MQTDIEQWRQMFDRCGYRQFLNAQLTDVGAESLALRIPFRDDIANPGGALHGGVMASAINIAGTTLARRFSSAAGDGGTLDLTVDYLSAAINEDIIATAALLRRGKEITYCEVDVRNDGGKRIAMGLVTHRIAPAAAGERQLHSQFTPPTGEAQMIRNAEMFVSLGFIAQLGMRVSRAHGGEAVLSMAADATRLDAGGALHEGALAALIDTTGALASWSIVGLNLTYKASTVGIHVNYFAPARGEVLARAQTRRRDNEIFLNRVEVCEASTGRVVADGSVTYRILVND